MGKAEIAQQRKQAGRDPDRLEITAFAPDGFFRSSRDLAEIAKAGANSAVPWLEGRTESEVLAELQELAGTVLRSRHGRSADGTSAQAPSCWRRAE